MVVADFGQSDGATWDGIRTYRAYAPQAGIPVLRFLHPRWTRLWAALKRAAADVYYVSGAGALAGQVAMFTRVYGRKLVVRIASNSDCDPRTLLIRFWRDKRLYQYGLKHADLVLAQTPEQQRTLLHNFGRTSRVAAPLAEPPRRLREFHERDIGVVWVSNMRPLKRPHLLFECARRLPDTSFHMIGGPMPGGSGFFEAVRAEALTLPNLHFHGAVPHQHVAEFYERARVLAGTSEIEGFPNTYLQSWAYGTPVVAFLDPDQLIGHNGLGQTVTSVDEMCQRIAALTRDPTVWEPASLRCTHFMESRFDESRMISPYIEALAPLHSGDTRGGRTFDRIATTSENDT